MEAVSDSRLIIIFSGNEKKDLVKRFDDLTTEYFHKKVNGSIRLHFSQGYLAKIESTQFE